MNVLTRIQKRANAIVAGAFRMTAGTALDIEVRTTPIKIKPEAARRGIIPPFMGHRLIRDMTLNARETAEQAMEDHHRINNQRQNQHADNNYAYTDGGGHDGRIEAALYARNGTDGPRTDSPTAHK